MKILGRGIYQEQQAVAPSRLELTGGVLQAPNRTPATPEITTVDKQWGQIAQQASEGDVRQPSTEQAVQMNLPEVKLRPDVTRLEVNAEEGQDTATTTIGRTAWLATQGHLRQVGWYPEKTATPSLFPAGRKPSRPTSPPILGRHSA